MTETTGEYLLCSPSLCPTSLTPSPVRVLTGLQLQDTMNLNDPACIRNHNLHKTEIHGEYESPVVRVTDHLKHTHKSCTHMLNTASVPPPALWNSWIIDWAYMWKTELACGSTSVTRCQVKSSRLNVQVMWVWVARAHSSRLLHVQSIIQIT